MQTGEPWRGSRRGSGLGKHSIVDALIERGWQRNHSCPPISVESPPVRTELESPVCVGLATIRELSEKQEQQRAMIGALLRGLARPGSHAAINNHGQPRYIGSSITAQP
jgi:hypothetical protein